MADNLQQRQQTAEAQKKETKKQETAALCKKCGAALEGELFCPSCGEKVGGEERTCEFCKTKTSNEFCPHCGRRVIPVPCPKCGTPTTSDACENCGTIINPILEKAIKQEAPVELKEISAEETKKIEADFKAMEANKSAEFKAFQKKLIERQILLEERDYFNKREKRIIKAFGSRPFTLELPDPAEEAFRMKAYAALEKTVIERDEKAIEAELDKMFPLPSADTGAEDVRLAEIERKRAEMEKKFNEALAKVNNEVNDFREEEERKRLEEERRRIEEERRRLEEERKRVEEERRQKEEARREAERQREIERQRLEEEQRRERINGSFYYRNNDFEMTVQITGTSWGRAYYNCFVCGGHAYLNFAVNISKDDVRMRCNRLSDNTCGLEASGHNDDRLNFTGRLNNSGTMMVGYWGNGSGSFRSQFFDGGDQANASSGTFYKY